MGEYLTAFHKHIMQLSVYQYFFVNSECFFINIHNIMYDKHKRFFSVSSLITAITVHCPPDPTCSEYLFILDLFI